MSIVAQLQRVAGADDDAAPLAPPGILRDASLVNCRQHGTDLRLHEAAGVWRDYVFPCMPC